MPAFLVCLFFLFVQRLFAGVFRCAVDCFCVREVLFRFAVLSVFRCSRSVCGTVFVYVYCLCVVIVWCVFILRLCMHIVFVYLQCVLVCIVCLCKYIVSVGRHGC